MQINRKLCGIKNVPILCSLKKCQRMIQSRVRCFVLLVGENAKYTVYFFTHIFRIGDFMKKNVGVMTDSHSGISREEADRLGIRVLPMPFYIEEECYYEDVTISRDEFYDKLKKGYSVSTSQPAPESVMNMWDEMLEEYEQIVYIPISSGLSGSCSTATALSMEEKYEGKVFVVDNGRVSTPMHRSVLDAIELADQGMGAKEMKQILEDAKEDMVIYIGVSTLEYLKKGGRIKPAVAAVGTVLNIKPVLKFGTGVLDTYKKCRGFANAKREMITAMKNELETNFKEQYEKGEVYLVAASSASKEVTDQWVSDIKAAFPEMDIMCDELSLGVACHIGYDGLGIGCSCKPRIH